MDLLVIPLLLLTLFGPVVALTYLASGHFESDSLGFSDAERTPLMLRVRSPLRLGALRAAVCGLLFALVAVLSFNRQRDLVEWTVLVGHAALCVGVTSFVERWAALRRRPLAGGALAGAAAVVIMAAGTFQALASAELLLETGPWSAVTALMSEQGLFLKTLLHWTIVATFTWAVPCAAITYGELTAGPGSHPVLLAVLFTLCAGAPAAIALATCYLVAAVIEARWPGERGRT